MSFWEGWTPNQKFAISMAIIAVIAGALLPFEAYREWLGFSQDFMTRDEVWETIDDYVDHGLGGSPYITTKPGHFYVSYVSVSGTKYYYALNLTTGGLYAYDDDSGALVNTVADTMTTRRKSGNIYLSSGEFQDWNTTVDVVGDTISTSTHIQEVSIDIVGEGPRSTYIWPLEGVHAFTLQNGTQTSIRNLGIEVVGASGVSAIYGYGGDTDERCMIRNALENLFIKVNPAATGAWAVELNTPWAFEIKGNNHFVSQGAGGINITNTMATQFCDSMWTGRTHIYISANDAIGILIQGVGTQATLVHNNALLYINGATASTNQTGLWMKDLHHSIFNSVQIEYVDTGVRFDDVKNVLFTESGYIEVDDGGTVFDIASTSEAVHITDMQRIHVGSGDTVTIIDDDVSDVNAMTVCENWQVSDSGGATIFYNKTTYTEFHNVVCDSSGLSENAGIATILDTTSSIQVTHGLWDSPRSIQIVGWGHEELGAAWVHAIGATTFNISLPAAATAARTMRWYASVNQRDN